MRPTKWTENAIKQAFDDFVKEYDRLPTKQEMYGEYNGKFPRPLSVKITLGITLGEYLNANYSEYQHRCKSRVYGRMTEEYWLENFKMQYVKLGKPSNEEYDKHRDKGTPNSKTLTRIAGVNTWSEFLEKCGFGKKKTELTGGLAFDGTLESYRKLREKLQEIIKDKD